MHRWRKKLFALMSRNARSATEFFQIPPNRVVELGARSSSERGPPAERCHVAQPFSVRRVVPVARAVRVRLGRRPPAFRGPGLKVAALEVEPAGGGERGRRERGVQPRPRSRSSSIRSICRARKAAGRRAGRAGADRAHAQHGHRARHLPAPARQHADGAALSRRAPWLRRALLRDPRAGRRCGLGAGVSRGHALPARSREPAELLTSSKISRRARRPGGACSARRASRGSTDRRYGSAHSTSGLERDASAWTHRALSRHAGPARGSMDATAVHYGHAPPRLRPPLRSRRRPWPTPPAASPRLERLGAASRARARRAAPDGPRPARNRDHPCGRPELDADAELASLVADETTTTTTPRRLPAPGALGQRLPAGWWAIVTSGSARWRRPSRRRRHPDPPGHDHRRVDRAAASPTPRLPQGCGSSWASHPDDCVVVEDAPAGAAAAARGRHAAARVDHHAIAPTSSSRPTWSCPT